MVTSAEKVEMLTRGAIDGERLLRSDEDIADWGACLPIVELLVGETTWNRLLPWVTLINIRYNAVWEGTPENLRRTLLESMKETGTLAQERYESARAEFLSIAREHLASLR